MPSTLKSYSFAECREWFEIADGYADDNEIVTDGELSDLPKLAFRRHGPLARMVEGCRFHVHSTATGNIAIFCAFSHTLIEIGAHVRLNADLRLWNTSEITIGDHTTINRARLVADNSEIHIGPDCMLSDDILIQSADQHGLIDLESMELINRHRRRIVIGEHVWVGRRSILMPDSAIGDGSVLGTGSILTKAVGPTCYAVGIPAKVVREGGSWTRQPTQANAREKEFFTRMKANDPATYGTDNDRDAQ